MASPSRPVLKAGSSSSQQAVAVMMQRLRKEAAAVAVAQHQQQISEQAALVLPYDKVWVMPVGGTDASGHAKALPRP